MDAARAAEGATSATTASAKGATLAPRLESNLRPRLDTGQYSDTSNSTGSPISGPAAGSAVEAADFCRAGRDPGASCPARHTFRIEKFSLRRKPVTSDCNGGRQVLRVWALGSKLRGARLSPRSRETTEQTGLRSLEAFSRRVSGCPATPRSENAGPIARRAELARRSRFPRRS